MSSTRKSRNSYLTRRQFGKSATLLGAVALLGSSVFAGTATAQNAYPERPVQIIVGFPPGGGVDTIARLISDQMQSIWGQPAIVENRPGASSSLAAKVVGAANADGYTILFGSNSMLMNQLLNPQDGYDVEGELRPILNIAAQHSVIVATPSLGVKTLTDVTTLARSKTLNLATPGVGSVPHLAALHAFSKFKGTNIQAIPFPGTAPALAAVMSGEVEIGVMTMPPAVPMITSGKVDGIALTSKVRAGTLPDIPTVGESGVEGSDFMTWVGAFVPIDTPDDVVDKIQASIAQAMAMPEVSGRLVKLGYVMEDSAGPEFVARVSSELSQWGALVKKMDLIAK